VPSVRLDSKGSVGNTINRKFFSTDDVSNGNRRALNSRHTEDCHLRSYNCMCHGTPDGFTALHTALHRVLAAALLHPFFPRDGHDLHHIHQHVSQSVQSCDNSKQLLQGENELQLDARRKL
jgi:hypothetical protein